VPVELHHIPTSAPSTSQPPTTSPSIQTTHDAEEPATMPHDSSQPRVQSLGSDEGSLTLNELIVLCTTLSKKKLEHKVKLRQPRRRAKFIVSDDEEDLEDSSKQGRKNAEIDQNPSISLILLDQEEPIELVEDLGSGKKGEKRDYIVIPEVSTAAENLVYIRTSAEKRKVKGKSIMKEDEYIDEEERQRIARDVEIAKQLQEEFVRARQEQKVVAEADQAHDIDWSDPVEGYKLSHFKGMSYEDIRPVFERVWDQNQSFVPKDSEIEKEVMKRPGFDFQKPPAKRQKIKEALGSGEEQSKEKEKEVLEEELHKLLMIVPIEVYIEALQVKYPIIDCEDMLKRFDRDDLEKLWDLVKKRFSSTEPTVDKEKEL
ncbi:hypothetical protein Tco_0175084, partial [Tanacetum coccineum]